MITMLEPQRLWLLAAVAAVAVAYARGRRRAAAYPVTLSTTRFVAEAQRRTGRGWRRHLPVAAFLGLLGLLVVGFARPAVETRVPAQGVDVVVALDTSVSMTATDVAPSRLAAARAAAAQFVEDLPQDARIGVVAFSGGASLALAPTSEREQVLQALASATGPGQGTAIGEAVGVGVAALSRLDGAAAGDGTGSGEGTGRGEGSGGGQGGQGGQGPDGTSGNRRVVVLSDGTNTAGRSVQTAAQEAVAGGVPVDTIAFGTAQGSVRLDGQDVPVPVADASLRELAEATGGRLQDAASTGELASAYDDIVGDVAYRTEQRELTGEVGLLAAALTVLVVLLGLRRAMVLPGAVRPGRARTGTTTG